MDRSTEIQPIFGLTKLSPLLTVKAVKYYPPPSDYTALRFQSNDFRIRAIEFWDRPQPNDSWFRVYHSQKIASDLKQLINNLEGFQLKTSTANYSDYLGDRQALAVAFGDLLADESVKEIVRSNPVFTRNHAYEGLVLPDVDVTDTNVMGRTFTWKDLIAISEDDSDENALSKVLSNPGVYLQRSIDGSSRYVGSAYGDGGILGRWIRHLTANGSAKHLNIFVLENGYANVLFTVLEFTTGQENEKTIAAESRWKETLGTRNAGPYDGFCLNSN